MDQAEYGKKRPDSGFAADGAINSGTYREEGYLRPSL